MKKLLYNQTEILREQKNLKSQLAYWIEAVEKYSGTTFMELKVEQDEQEEEDSEQVITYGAMHIITVVALF